MTLFHLSKRYFQRENWKKKRNKTKTWMTFARKLTSFHVAEFIDEWWFYIWKKKKLALNGSGQKENQWMKWKCENGSLIFLAERLNFFVNILWLYTATSCLFASFFFHQSVELFIFFHEHFFYYTCTVFCFVDLVTILKYNKLNNAQRHSKHKPVSTFCAPLSTMTQSSLERLLKWSFLYKHKHKQSR